ncbi:amidohydrolase family protein [Pseudomonas sp. NPDC089734]|uniref:amidohydrolase family protein n=1 Tax=Pseudomonas sp. NPDC089734 TaxID=3364469 RepID=UPI0037F8B12E
MSNDTGLDRRALLKAGALLGAGLAMPGCATSSNTSPAAAQKPAHLLIRHATILSMDPQLGDIRDGDVRIRDGLIVAVGKQLPIEGATVLDATGMILIPGIVDTHWHLWNSLMRNSAPVRGEAFFKTQLALSKRLTPELSALGVRLGLAQATAAGITTVNNWAHNIRNPAFAYAELQALVQSGLRSRMWYGYPQELAATAPMDFNDIQRFQKQLEAPAYRRVDLGMAIRGPERTEANIWQQEFAFARQHALPVSTHIGVTRQAQQKKAIQQLARLGLLSPDLQLVHATHVDAADLQAIAHSGATVCLTPLTEMRIGYGLPPVMALHDARVPLSLGIDTLVLSGNANPFMVMQTTLNLATAMSENEAALTAADVLYWATQGGADSMGLGKVIGSITVGKRADLALIDGHRLGIAPITDATASVVQSATPNDVDTVIAEGRLLKQGGKLLEVDTEKLANEAIEGWLAISRS